MIKAIRVLASLVVLLTVATALPSAGAQRGMPAPKFTTDDLAKLRWLEGRWRGTARGEEPSFEAYHFVNDSTIEITYYADPQFARSTGSGRVYLNAGRIFHTSGAGRWAASRLSSDAVYFVPEANAKNTFNWAFVTDDAWTATMRSAAGGQERVVVYKMERVR